MPLGRPTDDGEIVPGSRKYRGGQGTLGQAFVWTCPSCGRKVEGRQIEQGCPHCGAGDPSKSQAGQPAPAPAEPVEPLSIERRPAAGASVERLSHPVPAVPRVEAPQAQRIVRIIEYLIAPGQDAGTVLRNSLVGTMHFAWGQLTGTIVDSVDHNQEDRLRLAKLQPGVWLANPGAMDQQGTGNPTIKRLIATAPATRTYAWEPDKGQTMVDTPDTGPSYSAQTDAMAKSILAMGGYKLAYTLALALQSIAEELSINAEPEKFLTTDEALELANALMQLIPTEWTGIPPGDSSAIAPPPDVVPQDPTEDARKREIRERMAEAAKPTPVFREVPPDGQT